MHAFLDDPAPRLREIGLHCVALPFSAIRQVLSSTNNLVDLRLSNIPNSIYFSPDDLVSALSTLVQLEELTVSFHSPASSSPSSITPLPAQCITLPLLTFLDFHGTSDYLERFVETIGLPSLRKIAIKIFNQILFELPRLCRFIPRLNALGLLTSVFITHSVKSVSVTLHNEKVSLNMSCILKTSCTRLDWQVSFVTQILSQLSPQLFSVRLLSIEKGGELPVGKEDVDSTPWLRFFQPFAHVRQVYVWETPLVPGIVPALATEDMPADILPELISLSLSGYRSSPSVAKAAVQFVAMGCGRIPGRATVYSYSIDSEKRGALGSSQESNSLCLSTCITVHFLDASVTVRVLNISPGDWSLLFIYFSDFDVAGVLSLFV
jgi:hypothetical protein